ncbi:helix-turn-helix transcriptional regulator [Xinfangfangia sp. D13-10-4-6]|nr:helix-turn-helix transcriptional regulator [Pseudogemmobacter hezensis]
MARSYPDGLRVGWHSHRRGQLLCCASGYMSAQTMEGSFILPAGHGLVIAPDLPHCVGAHGQVEMRTLYIEPDAVAPELWGPTRVVRVSDLMGALLQALTEAPATDAETTEAGQARYHHLSALVLDELAVAPEMPFCLPWPRDKRLQRLCETLTNEPGHTGGLDDWAQLIGMSRRSLTRHCRDELNMSFLEWRRRMRLARVLKAQADGQPMEQIAREIGYRSPSALRSALRQTLSEVQI